MQYMLNEHEGTWRSYGRKVQVEYFFPHDAERIIISGNQPGKNGMMSYSAMHASHRILSMHIQERNSAFLTSAYREDA